MNSPAHSLNTVIWREIPDPEDPRQAQTCYCSGYDVYQDLLGKISWIEYLFLLFQRELPSPRQLTVLEAVAVAVANPGPRDLSVRAAMNAGTGGSTMASCLMAALAVAAGHQGGAREVYHVMTAFNKFGNALDAWQAYLTSPTDYPPDSWPDVDTPPGFLSTATACPKPVQQTLEFLASSQGAGNLTWLAQQRSTLENCTGLGLALTAVAAAAFSDLGFTPDTGEALYLLLRLPGASAHAVEQSVMGWRAMPFQSTGIHLSNDPGPGPGYRTKI